jgi:hypothetical protein
MSSLNFQGKNREKLGRRGKENCLKPCHISGMIETIKIYSQGENHDR